MAGPNFNRINELPDTGKPALPTQKRPPQRPALRYEVATLQDRKELGETADGKVAPHSNLPTLGYAEV